MIIRPDGNTVLFIAQPDHAQLAGDAIAHWRAGGFGSHPRRDAILLAAHEHDNGWIEEDAVTYVDERGAALDFVHAPQAVKHRLWPRAVERAALQDPYAAALIAQHAITVYSRLRADPEWQSFFDRMSALRTAMLERCGVETENLEADYEFVNAADRLSLAFCTGWTEALESFGRRFTLSGNSVTITPDPFDGSGVALRVRARRLPNRSWASSADLRAALDEAQFELLEGEAIGGMNEEARKSVK